MIHHVMQLTISTEDQLVNLGSLKIKRRSILHCFMWCICEGRVNEVCLSLCTSEFKDKTKQDEEIKYSLRPQQQRSCTIAAKQPQILVSQCDPVPENMSRLP